MDKIVTDEKILRQVSKDTTQEAVDRISLGSRLKEAVKGAWTEGGGLAAIQIGIPVRFAWYRWKGEDKYLLNPEIIMKIGKWTFHEACLSIPDVWSDVPRAYEIEYMSHGTKHRAKGVRAVFISHETDHMNGILNTDTATKTTKTETVKT